MEAVELEKVSLSDMQNLGTVFYTLTVDGKYSLLDCDKLTEPIQMQLYKKQKCLSEFFLHF